MSCTPRPLGRCLSPVPDSDTRCHPDPRTRGKGRVGEGTTHWDPFGEPERHGAKGVNVSTTPLIYSTMCISGLSSHSKTIAVISHESSRRVGRVGPARCPETLRGSRLFCPGPVGREGKEVPMAGLSTKPLADKDSSHYPKCIETGPGLFPRSDPK